MSTGHKHDYELRVTRAESHEILREHHRLMRLDDMDCMAIYAEWTTEPLGFGRERYVQMLLLAIQRLVPEAAFPPYSHVELVVVPDSVIGEVSRIVNRTNRIEVQVRRVDVNSRSTQRMKKMGFEATRITDTTGHGRSIERIRFMARCSCGAFGHFNVDKLAELPSMPDDGQ